MVDKSFRDRLHVEINPNDYTFDETSSGLKAWYDENLLRENLPPITGLVGTDAALAKSLERVLPESTIEALNATEFVGVFGRVLQSKDHSGMKCLQYLYVWDYQAVPEHEGDYEPVYVFIDGNERYAIYDLVHYCSRRIDLGPPHVDGPGLRMIPGWHSFLPDSEISIAKTDVNIDIKPLSDQHLQTWWNIPDEEAKLKIRKFLLNPFLLNAPGHFMDEPDENAQTICCTFVEIENAMDEFDNPRDGFAEGIKRALTKCVGILALYRLGAFIQLVNEMNDVGIIQVGTPLRGGLDLLSIKNMLRDGFIFLTNAGKGFLEGLQRHSQSEED
ncbi:MAG: hypothetical protein ACXACE_11690 [Candidatus Thorarchaeota archaeon]|jgi:hypothetical protein